MAQLGRRSFLKKSGQLLAVAPIASALPAELRAQSTTKSTAVHKTSETHPTKPPVQINVRELGAIGDGKTKDTLALQQSIDRCSVLGGGEVLFPAGDYLSGALALRSNTTLRIEEGATLIGSPDIADYPLAQVRWEGKWVKGHIGFLSAMDASNIGITGKGKILGSTAIKGRINSETKLRNPALLEFTSCKTVQVTDCYTQQNDMWSIHPTYCEDVTFRNVTVHGGADGIDIDSCRHVIIDHCEFQTADDCISLKSGRGMEGNTIARPTENIHISNCTFHDLHWACIGIGSETSAGIRNVYVDHCKCLSARTFAIYIKSRPGRGAFIENIFMNDLEVSGAQLGFLRLNFLDSGKQDEVPVGGIEGIPTVRNFKFTNIKVTDMPTLVEAFAIHPSKPLEGLILDNISGTCNKGIFLANIKQAHISNIHVTGYSDDLLYASSVTGTGLANAKPIPFDIKRPDLPPVVPFILK